MSAFDLLEDILPEFRPIVDALIAKGILFNDTESLFVSFLARIVETDSFAEQWNPREISDLVAPYIEAGDSW